MLFYLLVQLICLSRWTPSLTHTERLLTWLKPRHESKWSCIVYQFWILLSSTRNNSALFHAIPLYTVECDNRNVGRKVTWKSILLSQLWEHIKTCISHTNLANPIALQSIRHIRTELGQGFYGMVLTEGVNQTFPDQPEHASDRKRFHFKECFEKYDLKSSPCTGIETWKGKRSSTSWWMEF